MSERDYQGGELELFAGASRWKAYLASQLVPYIGGDVLEVGAGIGTTTVALHRSVSSQPHVRSWTAIEPDAALAARARTAVSAIPTATGPPVDVVVGVLGDLATTPAFDTILYVDVLEHIDDDADQLAQASTRLRPGGRVVVLAPAHPWLFSAFDASIGHFRRYDRASIRALPSPGMRLERCWYIDAAGLLVSAANRLVLRSSTPTPSQIKLWDRTMVPLSRVLDPLVGRRLGKSVIAVWTRDHAG